MSSKIEYCCFLSIFSPHFTRFVLRVLMVGIARRVIEEVITSSTRNRVASEIARGFESLTLRQKASLQAVSRRLQALFYCASKNTDFLSAPAKPPLFTVIKSSFVCRPRFWKGLGSPLLTNQNHIIFLIFVQFYDFCSLTIPLCRKDLCRFQA